MKADADESSMPPASPTGEAHALPGYRIRRGRPLPSLTAAMLPRDGDFFDDIPLPPEGTYLSFCAGFEKRVGGTDAYANAPPPAGFREAGAGADERAMERLLRERFGAEDVAEKIVMKSGGFGIGAHDSETEDEDEVEAESEWEDVEVFIEESEEEVDAEEEENAKGEDEVTAEADGRPPRYEVPVSPSSERASAHDRCMSLRSGAGGDVTPLPVRETPSVRMSTSRRASTARATPVPAFTFQSFDSPFSVHGTPASRIQTPAAHAPTPPAARVQTPVGHAETPVAHVETPAAHAETPASIAQTPVKTPAVADPSGCSPAAIKAVTPGAATPASAATPAAATTAATTPAATTPAAATPTAATPAAAAPAPEMSAEVFVTPVRISAPPVSVPGREAPSSRETPSSHQETPILHIVYGTPPVFGPRPRLPVVAIPFPPKAGAPLLGQNRLFFDSATPAAGGDTTLFASRDDSNSGAGTPAASEVRFAAEEVGKTTLVNHKSSPSAAGTPAAFDEMHSACAEGGKTPLVEYQSSLSAAETPAVFDTMLDARVLAGKTPIVNYEGSLSASGTACALEAMPFAGGEDSVAGVSSFCRSLRTGSGGFAPVLRYDSSFSNARTPGVQEENPLADGKAPRVLYESSRSYAITPGATSVADRNTPLVGYKSSQLTAVTPCANNALPSPEGKPPLVDYRSSFSNVVTPAANFSAPTGSWKSHAAVGSTKLAACQLASAKAESGPPVSVARPPPTQQTPRALPGAAEQQWKDSSQKLTRGATRSILRHRPEYAPQVCAGYALSAPAVDESVAVAANSASVPLVYPYESDHSLFSRCNSLASAGSSLNDSVTPTDIIDSKNRLSFANTPAFAGPSPAFAQVTPRPSIIARSSRRLSFAPAVLAAMEVSPSGLVVQNSRLSMDTVGTGYGGDDDEGGFSDDCGGFSDDAGGSEGGDFGNQEQVMHDRNHSAPVDRRSVAGRDAALSDESDDHVPESHSCDDGAGTDSGKRSGMRASSELEGSDSLPSHATGSPSASRSAFAEPGGHDDVGRSESSDFVDDLHQKLSPLAPKEKVIQMWKMATNIPPDNSLNQRRRSSRKSPRSSLQTLPDDGVATDTLIMSNDYDDNDENDGEEFQIPLRYDDQDIRPPLAQLDRNVVCRFESSDFVDDLHQKLSPLAPKEVIQLSKMATNFSPDDSLNQPRRSSRRSPRSSSQTLPDDGVVTDTLTMSNDDDGNDENDGEKFQIPLRYDDQDIRPPLAQLDRNVMDARDQNLDRRATNKYSRPSRKGTPSRIGKRCVTSNLNPLDVIRAQKEIAASVEREAKAPNQPRRSKRQRHLPIEFWRNEYATYERRQSRSFPTLAEVVVRDYVDIDGVPRPKKARKNLPATESKERRASSTEKKAKAVHSNKKMSSQKKKKGKAKANALLPARAVSSSS